MASKTSLALQLEKLKVPQTSVQKEKHGSASFLYDFSKAKTITLVQHYSNAINSLDNLILIDPYFKTYKSSLFHETSQKFDRAVQTKEANKELDQLIDEFLFHISKYFQLIDTHKVLEYLIQKYRIHEYNVDTLIGSVLPYHETLTFIRLLQTCPSVKNPLKPKFYWLKNIQESGVPLTKSTLIKHCVSNLEFTRFVTDSIFKALKIDPENTMYASFLTSFCLCLLQRSTKDMILSHLLSVISKCLSRKHPQLYTASYLIFSHLCNLVKLETKIVEKLLTSYIHDQKNVSECALMAFEIIVRTQELNTLPQVFIDKDFITNLLLYSNQYKLDALSRAIILTILCHGKNVDMYKSCLRLLLETSHSETTIKSIVNWINDQNNSSNDELNELNSYVIKNIERMFPEWFDLAISSLDSLKNITLYLNSIRYSVDDNTKMPLYVSIKHSDEQIRLQSLRFFAKNFPSLIKDLDHSDLLFIKKILLDDFLQEQFENKQKIYMLSKIIDVKDSLFNLFSLEEFGNFTLKIFKWIEDEMEVLSEKVVKLKISLVETYCSRSYEDYCKSKVDDGPTFLWKLSHDKMQQILLTNLIDNDQDLTNLILHSNYAKTNPLFKCIQEKIVNGSQPEMLSKNILNAIADYFHENIDVLFPKPNLWTLIQSNYDDNSYKKLLLIFLYCMSKILKNYPDLHCSRERTQIICQFYVDLLLHMSSTKISGSGCKLKNVDQFEEYDLDEHFLLEFSQFKNHHISLLLFGYLIHCFMVQIGHSDDLPSSIDWYLTDVNDKFISYDCNFKIYNLLLYYSTPNEEKPISKKVYKFFQHLFSLFTTMKIKDHSSGLKFFLPCIVTESESIQEQTLRIIKDLFRDPTTSSFLIECLQSNHHFLISFLMILTSKNLSIRRLTLSNLKKIVKHTKSDEALKKFTDSILSEEQILLTNECYIQKILAQLHSKKDFITEELFNTIISMLTEKQSSILSTHKVSLLKLLSFCNLDIKSAIFDYYSELIMAKNDKLITEDEESQLEEVILYFHHEIFNDQNFSEKYSRALQFLLNCIKKTGSVLSEKISILIYNLLTPSTFKFIYNGDKKIALDLVGLLLKHQLELSEKQSSSMNYSILIDCMQKKLRSIMVDCEFIVEMMHSLLPIEDIYEIFTQIPKDKRFKGEDAVRKSIVIGWKLFRIYVSCLSNIENLDCSNNLMRILFEYLKLTFMEVNDNANEQTRQTILNAIINCVEWKLFKRDDRMQIDDDEDEQKILNDFINNINVDVIIDCMLESRVKEIQRISLLLISMLAPHFRKQIIEYLVTIFTFIGSNLLECDDQYSLAILFETMQSIIPIIIDDDDQNDKTKPKKESALDLKNYIVSVFIKSFKDIPNYRRLLLFSKLIQLLDTEHFLPIITIRLMEQMCSIESSQEKDAIIEFLHQLFREFSLEIRLKSICTLLGLFGKKLLDNHFRNSLQKKMQAKNKTNQIYSTLIQNNQMQFNSLIDLNKSICKDFKVSLIYEEDKLSCGLIALRFVSMLIASDEFVAGIRSLDYNSISLPLIYLVNIVLELIILLSPGGGLRSTMNVYRKSFKTALDDILLKYTALIPNEKLLDIVIDDLLNNTAQMDPSVSILIKRKALEILNEKFNKLNQHEMNTKTAMDIIEKLFKHLKNYHENIKELDENEIHNIQLILLSLKLLNKFLETEQSQLENVTILSDVLHEIIQIIRSIDESQNNQTTKSMQNLKTSSILCLTQVLSTLSLEGIIHLSNVINLILENFDSEDEIVIISNVSSIYKIVQNFSKFLSPHLKSLILKVLPIFSNCDNIKDLRPKLNLLWMNIAKLVPKRIIFETVDDLYETVSLNSPLQIVDLMYLFKLSCDSIEKSDVEIILKSLKNFILKALSYRSVNYYSIQESVIEQIETSFCEALAAFIPKLTESHFRPIYYSLVEWAIQVDESKFIFKNEQRKNYSLSDEHFQRMISFYRFCSFLADRLKSLFCVFVAPTIVRSCNQILIAYHSPETDVDAVSEAKESEPCLMIEDAKIGEPLVTAVLSTIGKCFLYDLNGSFFNKDYISLIIKPMVNQISNLHGTDDDYETRLNLILQCTQHVVQNNRDESFIKDFNYQILLKTRDDNEKVKAGAIKVLHRLILACNEDYIPFIPETMPFIAELSEDDSGLVEKQLKLMITDIEQLIGEPINKYL